jgi:hypothetical protein
LDSKRGDLFDVEVEGPSGAVLDLSGIEPLARVSISYYLPVESRKGKIRELCDGFERLLGIERVR